MDEFIGSNDDEYNVEFSGNNNDFDFSDSESEMSLESHSNDRNNKINTRERIEMIKTRSYINKINEDVAKKFEKLQQLKGELNICENHVEELMKEEETTITEIESNRKNENIAAVFRLQSQLKRIKIEIEGEKELRELILDKINKADKDYIKSQLEQGKYVSIEENLKKQEEIYANNDKEKQEKRLLKEKKLTTNSKKAMEALKKNQIKVEFEKDEQKRNELETMKSAHIKHSKYLNKTIEKNRASKKQLEKTIQDKKDTTEMAFQKLNADISHIKENLKAVQSKKNADLLLEKEKEMKLRESVMEQGGNPNLEVKLAKKQIKIAKEKEQFESLLKEKKLKIADKILAEEENLKRKISTMPHLFQDRFKQQQTVTKGDLTGTLLQKLTVQQQDIPIQSTERWESWEIRSNVGKSSDAEDLMDTFESSMIESNFPEIPTNVLQSNTKISRLETDVNVPEFEGLWDTTVNYKVPKSRNNLHIKTKNASKMDQEIMNRVLGQLKENIVRPQIVNGKVFKAHSFQSKPDVILFENLEVDGKYQQKVTLTNTSYAINQCRFERISENLLDFITVKFSPPGPLSPGMTCEFTVMFEPKLDQDLFGEIYFTSQSERFSIPVSCLTKKCKMIIDKQVIKFDTTVIGETLIQSVKTKNTGAKGTFCFIENKTKSNLILKKNQVQEPTIEKDETDIKDSELYEDQSITTSLDRIKLWIEGNGEQEIFIKWCPIYSGDYFEEFFINFEDEDNEGFDLKVMGKAIEVPVYLEQQTISMNICMFDRLYQDTVTFHSRASTALKLQFHVPKEMKDYLEILPNSGFIQAGQSFKAQIKLLVNASICKEGCSFFDEETGILDVPIKASIANQVKTVDFNLQAILTVTDLEIIVPNSDNKSLDFGYCTIKETKVKTIYLLNKSILPQEFGFTGYPEFVDIQPNYGYGIILPKETLEFQILFSPLKAEDFEFQLGCQSLIDRSFILPCRGVGVHPVLEISKHVLNFSHTAINDYSKLEVFIENNHLSTNIYTHEPPRIGSGPVSAIGPQTFKFILPENAPIFIHPVVGSLNPGEKQKISIFFHPKLLDDIIKLEAANLLNKKLEIKAKEKWEEEIKTLKTQNTNEESDKTDGKSKKSGKKPIRPTSDKSKSNKLLDELIEAGPASFEKKKPEDIETNSNDFLKGKLSLLQKFDFNFEIFNIKCLMAPGHISDKDLNFVYNLYNTLYLELHCPSVKPDLIILSNSGSSVIDFGQHIVHKKVQKSISVQNISSKHFQIRTTLLDPNGAFRITNAVRVVNPNEVINLLVEFNPKEEGIYQSNWSMFEDKERKTLKLFFKGTAVTPKIELKEVEHGIFNAGTVLVNEFCEKSLTILNNSSFDVDFYFDLSSQERTEAYLSKKNKNSLSVFTISPHKGTIAAGKPMTVTVTFAPDHASENFMETVTLFLFENVKLITFSLRGEAKSQIMYIKSFPGSKKRTVEYLGETWTSETNKIDESVPNELHSTETPLILQAIYLDGEALQPGRSSFAVGCVRTLAVSQKKNGEFNVDNLNILTSLGFNIEPSKGQIEADTEKVINVSWCPLKNYEIGSVVYGNINITLKGDITYTQSIEIRGFVM